MSEAGREEAAATRTGAHGVLLAISSAAFAFLCLVFAYLKGGITEKEESRIFVFSCVIVPLVGVVGSWAYERTKRDVFPNSALFHPVFSAAHVAFWAVALHRLRALSPAIWKEKDAVTVDFTLPCRRLIIAWFAGNIVLLAAFWVLRKRPAPAFAPLAVRAIERLLPFGVVAAILPFLTRNALPRGFLVLLAVAGLASVMHEELARFPKHRTARLTFDALVLVGMVLIVIDPAMDVDFHHSNFFLGPAAAVRAGRSLLVDVNCQYGVGSIYFLAAILDLRTKLIPPTIEGFSTLLGIMAAVQWAVIYGTLRSITKSPGLSAIVFLLILVSPRLEQVEYATTFPSTGAFRFIFGFLLVGCFALRGPLRGRERWVYALEAIVVGAASVWSFESFVYVFVAYLGSLVYEAVHVGRRNLVQLLEDRILPAALSVSWFHLALALLTRWRSGHWPHWSLYIDYLKLYSTEEFGTLPIETWTPWLPLAGALMLTVIALGYRRITLGRTDLKTPYAVVFAMSALGIAQFTYYLGRSHPNNLFHIAPPAFFVAGYWFIVAAESSEHVSRAFRKSFVFVCYGACAFVLVHAMPDVEKKIDHTWLAYLATGREWNHRPTQTRVADAIAMMNKYAPGQRRVAYFTHPDSFVEMSLLTRRTSLWPEAYAPEDGLLESARRRIANTDSGLKAGDIVFADTLSMSPITADEVHLMAGVEHVDRDLFNRLATRFKFELVESRPSGAAALRLRDR